MQALSDADDAPSVPGRAVLIVAEGRWGAVRRLWGCKQQIFIVTNLQIIIIIIITHLTIIVIIIDSFTAASCGHPPWLRHPGQTCRTVVSTGC